ncbi:adhesion G protein-coupled receptor E3-like [Chanos chanos]|uniref:Adhesion G protein-coupled receptor E3-like n=1 Tax=Chanos chanos TaxID=29144 RepID=A0A6J2VWL6_CHACN|nr:adhesion G protein-coupled receptor E3-like [Chanos chanos]
MRHQPCSLVPLDSHDLISRLLMATIVVSQIVRGEVVAPQGEDGHSVATMSPPTPVKRYQPSSSVLSLGGQPGNEVERKNICQDYRNISDPWRNVRFNSTASSAWPKINSTLHEGWYRFTGIGGDIMAEGCSTAHHNGITQCASSGETGHPVRRVDLCDKTSLLCSFDGHDDLTQLQCPDGFFLYYLFPTQGLFLTGHYRCDDSSCGENAQCVSGGGCVCKPGLKIPDGHLPTRDSYGCTSDSGIKGKAANKRLLWEVTTLLRTVLDSQEMILAETTDPDKLVSLGNSVIHAIEKLVSTLVKPTDAQSNESINTLSTEVRVFTVGPNTTVKKIPPLDTNNTLLDIDLVGISKNNREHGNASVSLVTYKNMAEMLKPSLFHSENNTVNTMMSTVVSAFLPKTTNKTLTKPVNFTLKHIREMDPKGLLRCVYWNVSEWVVDGCSITETNSSYTVCSCVHLSTFALIMQTKRPPKSNYLMEIVNTVAVTVGLVFLFLAVLTFAVLGKNSSVTNTALLNLSLCLLLAHLLFLLTQHLLPYIRIHKRVCAAIAGTLHFLFLSAFVWMFIEAIILFITVKNLSKIRSKQEVVHWGFLLVIGYVISLAVVSVSVGVVPDGYGSEECWIKKDKGFTWSFLGPVCFILGVNLILFIAIITILKWTLMKVNTEVSQLRSTRTMVFKSLAQFIILGCPWILGPFTHISENMELVFLFFNSQQGTFIFLVHCVLSKEVRKQYRKWWLTLWHCHKSSSHHRHSAGP